MNFRPAVLIPIVYGIGISAFVLGLKSFNIVAIILVFTPVLTGAIYAFVKKKSLSLTLVWTIVFQLILVFGFFNFKLRYDIFFSEKTVEGECLVKAVYEGESESNGVRYLNFAKAEISDGETAIKGQKITVSTTAEEKFEYGNVISIYADFSPAANSYNGSRDLYACSSGVRYTGKTDFSEFTVNGNRPDIFGSVRRKLENVVKSGTDEKNAAFINAMIFGDKTELSASVLTGMKNAGVAHLFAVSGLHVGFITAMVYVLLKKIRVNRWISFAVTCAVSFFYCGICGFSPSSVRAFIMTAFFLLHRIVGVKYDMLNGVFLSAGILLLIKPEYLISYGFVLSYAAVISITVMVGPISRLLGFLPLSVRNSVSAVLAAQIGTLPFSVAFFGYVSWISAYLNFIVIPLVSVLFVISLSSVAVSAILPFAKIFMFIPNILVGAANKFVSEIDFSFFTTPLAAGGFRALIYCAGILAASDLFNLKFSVKASVCSVALVLYVVFSQLFTFGIL